MENGIVFADQQKPGTVLDVDYKPSSVIWNPQPEGDVDIEDRFIVAFDSLKLKEFNADSKQCRKTTISPTRVGKLFKMCLVPQSTESNRLFAFATNNRVLGVGCFPLSGNPTKVREYRH